MKRVLCAALALAALSIPVSAEPDFAGVGVGDNNSLVIPGLLSLPAPSPDWEWMVGDTIERSGVIVRVFFCQHPQTEVQYQLLVYTLPQPITGEKEKREFITGLLDGAVRGAANQGFQIEKEEITTSSIPSPGFHRYDYVLRKKTASLLLTGYMLIQKHSISLQYSSQDSVDQQPFVDFVGSLQLADGVQAEGTSGTDAPSPRASPPNTTLSYRIGRLTGYILIGIVMVAIIVKILGKKKS